MYVLVHHTILDPDRFWRLTGEIPSELILHHTLAATDGTLATCLWEAESVEAVQRFLDPLHEGIATNVYRQAENREGFVIPTRYAVVAPPLA